MKKIMSRRGLIILSIIIFIIGSIIIDIYTKEIVYKRLSKSEITEIKTAIKETKKVKMYNVNLKEERLIDDDNYIKYFIENLTKFKNVKPVQEKYTHDRRLQLSLLDENEEQIMRLTINDYYLFLEEHDEKKYNTVLYVPADFLYELALAFTNENSKIFKKVSTPKIETVE